MEEVGTTSENLNLGELLVETGAAMTSLILFPAIAQRLSVSPIVVNAIKIALKHRK